MGRCVRSFEGRCPTCGTTCIVQDYDDGTSDYDPKEKPKEVARLLEAIEIGRDAVKSLVTNNPGVYHMLTGSTWVNHEEALYILGLLRIIAGEAK